MRALLLLAALAGGCTDETKGSLDMTVFMSACGKPGDPGNSLGVGKFCTVGEFIAQCGMNKRATACTNIAVNDEFFCTMVCDGTDGGAPDQCGENAHCACDPKGRGCGCYPDYCP
jgi:hypothetical protein